MTLPFRLLALGLLVSVLSPAVAAPRNIVLVVSDDHGRDAGFLGHPVLRTPHLDRLAAEATVFDLAFCTSASCSASRAVLLTGLHNHASGQFGHEHAYNNFHTYPGLRSLPARLAEAGYRTARIGKFHVQPEAVYRFETVLEGNPGGARNPVSMAERCREFLAAADPRPFFLYFCPSDPHRGGGFADDLPGRPDWFGNHARHEGVTVVRYDAAQAPVPPWLPDTPETRAELAQYFQSVSRLDQGVGRLIEILRETGRWRDTLFVYLSDNGSAFPGSKTTLYEPGLRLPLLVYHPDAPRRGVRNDALVSWTDITPTLLDYAGALTETERTPLRHRAVQNARPAPAGFHGRSFLGLLGRTTGEGWDEVFASHTFHEITMYYPMRAVRTRQFKYIVNLAHPLPFPLASDLWESPTWQAVRRAGAERFGARPVAAFLQRPREELYDLAADPHEARNLAAYPAHAGTLAALRGRVREFMGTTGDPWVVKWERE